MGSFSFLATEVTETTEGLIWFCRGSVHGHAGAAENVAVPIRHPVILTATGRGRPKDIGAWVYEWFRGMGVSPMYGPQVRELS